MKKQKTNNKRYRRRYTRMAKLAGCCKTWDDITIVSVTKEEDAWMEGKTIIKQLNKKELIHIQQYLKH